MKKYLIYIVIGLIVIFLLSSYIIKIANYVFWVTLAVLFIVGLSYFAIRSLTGTAEDFGKKG